MTVEHQVGPLMSPEDRLQAWEVALGRDGLPPFVEERLAGAAAGSGAWVATMTPSELLLARSHGIRPIATVSGTCWFHYGQSWTQGHAQGWHEALDRIVREAVAAGANAVVDVRMRTLRHRVGASMDYTLIGTAVRIDGLAPSPHPVVATVPALEFVRLLEMGIVPVGLAVGARFEWLTDTYNQNYSGSYSWTNRRLPQISDFWEMIRRRAHAELRADAARQGTGVLAHTQFGQLFRQEVDKQPTRYLGRHIVIGTVVDSRRGDGVPHHIRTVVDMRDALSPLLNETGGPAASDLHEHEGGI